MEQIPDAPWIRDAELNGWGPEEKPVKCPVCYEECEQIYFYKGSRDALGCDRCIDSMDAYDWQADQDEEGRDGDDW